MLGIGSLRLERTERLVYCNQALLGRSHFLVGITRVRNESLILRDTLDHVGNFVDAIVAYDDASTDSTRDILKRHPKVALIIENSTWQDGQKARLHAETRHRAVLLDAVKNKLKCEWVYCFDADERIVENPRDFLHRVFPDECNGVRVQLFDAYITPTDFAPYESDQKLLNFRRYFGFERRDILMLWRNASHVRFQGIDAREPAEVTKIITYFHCQHYGKAISIPQWEETCDYYAKHFPWETYGHKWQHRKGQAIHTQSDFSHPLCEWGPSLFSGAINITNSPVKVVSDTSQLIIKRLALLLATNHLSGWTGSETMLLTLIEGLLACDCEVVVYVRHLNESWAKRYVNPRVQLIDNLDTLSEFKFDLAHVQHNSCLLDVRATFPTLPILFSSLGVLPFLEQPVFFDVGVSQYLAISEEVMENLTKQAVSSADINIFRNVVNDKIFRPLNLIRPNLERILVLSYRMEETQKVLLRVAARELGASIRFVGSASETLTQDQLANAINEADVVVSIGRGVVEAMFCGRIPFIFDVHGGDGFVTPDSLGTLQTCNFSGRYSRREYTLADLISALKKYRQDYGVQLRELAQSEFGLERNMPRLLKIYAKTMSISTRLSDKQLQAVTFCSSLARLDLQQSKLHCSEAIHNRNEVQRVKNTISWRITKPLRLLATIARFFWNIFPGKRKVNQWLHDR